MKSPYINLFERGNNSNMTGRCNINVMNIVSYKEYYDRSYESKLTAITFINDGYQRIFEIDVDELTKIIDRYYWFN